MKGYLLTKAFTSLVRLDKNDICAFDEELKGL